ncbi:hypothetical protein BJY04DRAFT_31513 [Aspergillus karnatakaensis]|uniref:bZIP transcription factor n=1 Tax=Aspergillus karnatakaensis TaxID=1810916 RepID=UPI003CCCC061
MDKIKEFTTRWSLKDGDNEPKDPIVRRKEQVRKAQQNYRQRKEGYIKSLEREVIHLRTSRSELQGETRKLTFEIEWLRHIVAQHSITLPPMPPVPEPEVGEHPPVSGSVSPATVCVGRDHLNNKRMIVLGESSGTDSPTSTHDSVRALDLVSTGAKGDVVAGMNFILSLEGPCLDHVRDALGAHDPEGSHGHALTLTASVFQFYDGPSATPAEDELVNVSKQTLDRLLQLSSQLPIGEELTPIQIWAHLCQSGWVESAQPQQRMAVAEELLNHVKCHGYGAVIPREVVMSVIARIMNDR